MGGGMSEERTNAASDTAEYYTCAQCGETFAPGWGEDEAQQEMRDTFPGASAAECDVVCVDCYQKIMRWWRESHQ
jgi:DNA-directed RNA polymerase subunit RPC12/RpoP